MKFLEKNEYGSLTLKSIAKLIGLGITGLGLLIILIASTYTVKTGEIGIITKFGKVSRVAKEGMNFKLPFVESVTKIETRDRILTGKYMVSSEDIQTVETEVSVQYRVINAMEIFKRFKDEYGNRLVNPRMAEVIQATTSNYTIEELVAKRQQLGQDIYKNLREDLMPFGIEVVKVSIVNHDFSDEFEKAIEAKKVAEQNARAQEVKNQQNLKNAENNLRVNLHYTLLLLIRYLLTMNEEVNFDLHYTLLLLIQCQTCNVKKRLQTFTLHFATINT